MRRYIAVLFLLWTGVIIVAYFVVQKPSLLGSFAGLIDTVWTLFVAIILYFNAYGLGKRILAALRFETNRSIDHLLFSVGIGFGSLGLLGLFFSVAQLATANILTAFQVALAIFFLLRNDLKDLRVDLSSLASNLNRSFSQYSLLTKLALLLTLTFSFLLTLVPPFEAFDALLYHLTLPAKILQNGGLQIVNNAPFWFPSLCENVYLWTMGMGSERAAQIIHFSWALLAILLLWHWSIEIWNIGIARKTLLLLASIPSLPMLASWAYADMALVYYATGAIYAFTRYRIVKSSTWLVITGLMAGFAMGIKYTSFVVPLSCGFLILFDHSLRKAISSAARFSFITLAIASPWYIRNIIFMGNPFYPFIFRGRYWDSFLVNWYADAGTGIGWNALSIILVPMKTTMGSQDVIFFDGRIGPLFLILAPFTIWILLARSRRGPAEGWSLLAIGVFSLLSFTAWTFGVINSSALWQARLLFPALILFTIPTALAWDSLKQFDTPKLRISFLANALIGIVIALTIIDNAFFVLQRNPLVVAVGAQSREKYIERINPSYAALMKLMAELPAGAQVYSLFEPRSYGLPRLIQPDPINSNFPHDVYLYNTPDAIIQNWKSENYTHVLVSERGRDFMSELSSNKFSPDMQEKLVDTLGKLTLINQTPDKVYSLYQIP